jgi:hypothetical protein
LGWLVQSVNENAEAPLLQAIVEWFSFYSVPFEEEVANVLCDRAIMLYNQGASGSEITEHLLTHFVGLVSTKANAPTSSALH